MKSRIILITLLGILILVALCLAKSSNKVQYLWNGFVNPPEYHPLVFGDGYQGMYYQFTLGSKKPEPDTIIFFFSGSNTLSLRYYLKPYFKGFKLNATVYALQKRNIGNWSIRTGKDFDQSNYLEQWLDDDAFLIKHILKTLKTGPTRIIAYGVSEGGNRAVVAAAKFKAIANLVVLGSGGLQQSEELIFLNKYFGGSPKAYRQKYREIAAHPEAINQSFLGWPYKYWSHVLFFDPASYYLQLKIPIFIGFGAQDRSVPVESGYFLRDRFKELGKSNLYFLEMEDCGHTFTDSKGISHLSEVFDAIQNWLNHN
jgi:pimeloyl-ACP methyl ester carboxylesterase